MERQVQGLAALGVQVDAILTSPLVRNDTRRRPSASAISPPGLWSSGFTRSSFPVGPAEIFTDPVS